jgi:hypothetical protein|tara:strand:+ start:129 stop:341 length:213 start_codon:yes stop_codon:yes gene_type:complete
MFQDNNYQNKNQNQGNPEKSPRERYEICVGGMWNDRCDEYKPNTNQCRSCGCFVNAKVKIATEKCPLGKW